MYHLRLAKGLSYFGVVSASHSRPDVFVEDKETADKAVATGYFKLMADVPEPPEAESQEDELDVSQLPSMSLAELKALAKQLDVDLTGRKGKEDIIEAICVANGGSQTMIDLQKA